MTNESLLNLTTIEKKDIALKQLRRAIQLYRENDYVCSVTLAGAAEEILGKITTKREGYCSLDVHEKEIKEMAKFFMAPIPEKKKIYYLMNAVKNELKHNDSGDNVYLKADFESHAFELISRAIMNYRIAYQANPPDRVIMNFIDSQD